MGRFVTLFVALVVGVGVAVWYYRGSLTDEGPVSIVAPRNDDRWLDGLQSRTPKDVEAATAELEQRGTAALPLIRTTLQDPSTPPDRRKPAMAPLREAAASDEPVVRRESLRSLGKLRERASIDPQVVVPLLLGALHDPDAPVRIIAVTYLGIVRDNPAKEVAGLIDALKDDDAGVRQTAAVALGAYGAQAEPAIPALKKAENDPDDDVKREAGRALVIIAEARQKQSRIVDPRFDYRA